MGRGWTARIAVVAAGMAACGPSETSFVVDYTDAYCTWYLACADPALLVFDGLDDVDACKAVVGPEIAVSAGACKVDHAAARACLGQMATVPCPEPGTVFEDAVPLACTQAWKKCDALPGDDPADDSGTSGT